MDRNINCLMKYNALYKENDDIYRQFAKKMNISESELWILYVMRLYGEGLTQKELCDVVFMPKQSVNTALKKMEKDGYIVLEYAENSRKNKVIKFTEKGLRHSKKTADKIIEAERSVFAHFSDEEIEFWFEINDRFGKILKMKTLEE